MRIRAAALAMTALAATVLAGCSGDNSSPPIGSTQPGVDVVDAAPPTEKPAPPACDPRASLRPTGALPAPGKMPARSYMATIQKRGRLVLGTCEEAARAEGFRSVELMGTLSGRPLYEAAGYSVVEHLSDDTGGTAVPLVRMRKPL